VREDGSGVATVEAFGRATVGIFQITVSGVGAIGSGEQVGTPRTIRPEQVGGIPTGGIVGSPLVGATGGGTGLLTPPRSLTIIRPQPQQEPQPQPTLAEDAAVAGAGGIASAAVVASPTLVLLPPPEPPADPLAREREELALLGIIDIAA
jgi:hypothetical protein